MKKIAFLFSGQGSQYVGMSKELYTRYSFVKEIFNCANDILGYDLKKICFEGSSEELSKTEITQPAIFVTSIAQFKAYMNEFAQEPTFLAGHSVGEYSALTCSEAIKFDDALKLVQARGTLMSKPFGDCRGKMVVVRNLNEKITLMESDKLSSKGMIIGISNYNGRNNVVVSGEDKAIELITPILERKGAEVIQLRVSSAFHSLMMKEASEKLKDEISKYQFYNPKFKVISNVEAVPYRDKDQIINMLPRQIIEPVKWSLTMKYLEDNETDIAIEFGPKATLRNLIKSNTPRIEAFSYDKEEDVVTLKEILKSDDTTKKYSIISRCLGIAVCTKNNSNDNAQYEKGVIKQYEKLEKIEDRLKESGKNPTTEEVIMAIEMLKSVFTVKGTSKNEQDERFKQLFNETNLKEYLEYIES